MPALLQSTEAALGGGLLSHCESRSLRLTRYADPTLKEDHRKAYLEAVTKGQRESTAATATLAWQRTLPGAHQIHAKLEARLLLNMAGSVLENAGLGLDRYGNVPIPGSALKGCARRAALATLRQWSETNEKPTGDDLLTTAAAPFNTRADLLLAILHVFGCTDLEWDGYNPAPTSKDKNDLAWACGDDLPAEQNQWATLRDQARAALHLSIAPSPSPRPPSAIPPTLSPIGYPPSSMRDAPTRRGAIAFLPAYPAKAANLELDVLTPHHKDYYDPTKPKDIALDDEDPVPVFFPAVAAGSEYTFTLVPIGRADSPALDHAAAWLLTGLTTFGLGGKTAAGYGWFADITEDTNKRETTAAKRRQETEAAAAEEKRHAEELAARKTRAADLAAMSPDSRADSELIELTSDKGRLKAHLTKFQDLPDEQKASVLRWFAREGAGRELWLGEIKTGQGKPKDAKVWKQIVGQIHAAKKALKIDLP